MSNNVFNKALLFLSALALLGCNQEEDKYYRADCIVRINIDWSGYDTERRLAIQNRVLPEAALAYHETLGFDSPVSGPSSSIKGEEREYYYLQFSGLCDRRYEFSENIIAYFAENFDDVPPLEVDPGTFKPGRDTIEVYGDSWIDGERVYQPQ
ncbi:MULTISPECIES: hypothetical protein [Vreelandella]|uniref:Lipoprotein n=1 Tax=Halomonas johnsoniae TaxID=502832 RepID=A0ABQ2WE53_9GAMM|nr:hypothetical protein [Halomonas johnsoniae]GGW47561.1 hypothetical protein GCM10007158_05730 [Halomonas johnsoniae]